MTRTYTLQLLRSLLEDNISCLTCHVDRMFVLYQTLLLLENKRAYDQSKTEKSPALKLKDQHEINRIGSRQAVKFMAIVVICQPILGGMSSTPANIAHCRDKPPQPWGV